MKFQEFEIENPRSVKFEDRIEWCGERLADLAEGMYPPPVGWFIWQWIVGWTDIGVTPDEAVVYHGFAQRIAELIRAQEEGRA